MRWTFGQNLQEYRKILKPGFGRFWKEQFGRILGLQIAYTLMVSNDLEPRTMILKWFFNGLCDRFFSLSCARNQILSVFSKGLKTELIREASEREHSGQRIGCHSDQITINRGIFRSEFVLIQAFCGELTKKSCFSARNLPRTSLWWVGVRGTSFSSFQRAFQNLSKPGFNGDWTT